jgi:hypothetical protein
MRVNITVYDIHAVVMTVPSYFLAYVSSLPASALPHLDQQLDWDHEGVDRDLIGIAHHMLDWEEKLCAHLGLTAVEVHDIKAKHPNKGLNYRGELLMGVSDFSANYCMVIFPPAGERH